MSAFLQIKAERLLVPLVIVGTLYILLQNLTPGVNNRPPSLPFVYPFAHFWFLQSLYLLFVLLAVLDRVGLLESMAGFLACLLASIFAYIFLPSVAHFGFAGAMYLLPFLLLGLGLSRFGGTEQLERRNMRMAVILVLAVLFLSFGDPTSGARQTSLHLVAACAVLLLLVGSGLRSELLERISDYSSPSSCSTPSSAPRRGCCCRMRVCRRFR
jgi:hypothetical protein